ncbi:MAG: type II toxin-antitoxin system RelE/ParE family toxin [Nitrospirae bacterium]|nr:type II toxin-antitoxin system RelE/ParE family toxin [Nitrospirota bacterium]
MAWTIKIEDSAIKELKKIDKTNTRRILDFLDKRVAKLEDPRSIGEALKGAQLGNFWKYRIGDYRVICDIQDSVLLILVLRIGNRSEIYRK